MAKQGKTEKINTPDAKLRQAAQGKHYTEVNGYIAMFGMDIGGGVKLDPKDKLTLPKWMVEFLKIERDEFGILATLQLPKGEWPPVATGTAAPTKPASPPPVPTKIDPRLLGNSERAHLIILLEKEKFTIKDDDILNRTECKKLRDKLSGVTQGSLFDDEQPPPTKTPEQIKKDDAEKAKSSTKTPSVKKTVRTAAKTKGTVKKAKQPAATK